MPPPLFWIALGVFLVAALLRIWVREVELRRYQQDVDRNIETARRTVGELVDQMGRDSDDALASDVGAVDGSPRSRRSR